MKKLFLVISLILLLTVIIPAASAGVVSAQAPRLLLFWDGGTAPTGWTSVSASGGAFYQRFPRGAATYGGTGGTTTHTHTLSLVTCSVPSDNVTRASGTSTRPSPTHTHIISSSTVPTASNLPSYRNLQVISYNAGIPATIPAGAIAIFDTTPPSGWTQYAAENTDFVRGEAAAGGTGGSNTNTHSVSITTSGPSATIQSSTGTGNTVARETHTHTGSGTSAPGDNQPPYREVILAQANSTTSIPLGMIGMFDASPTACWTVTSNVGGDLYQRFIKGSSSYGTTGGADTHSHTNLTIATGAPSNTRSSTTGTATTVPSYTHTHSITVSFGTTTYLPPYRDVIFAKLTTIPPTANFTGMPTSGNPPLTVQFTDASTGSPTSWSWSFPGGNPSTASGPGPHSVIYSSVGSYNVTLTVTNACGSDGEVKTGYIIVGSPPTVIISGTTTICQGISTTLTASASGGIPPYTYLWSTGTTATSENVTVAGTYSVTATDNISSRASANATVTVNPAPIVTFSGNPNICGTGSTVLTANVSGNSPPYTYDWSPSTAPGSGNGNIFTANGAGTVAVTVTDNLGCKGRAKTIVSVKSPPTVTISGTTSICEGNSTTLTANPLGGTPPYTYLWSTGATTPSINVTTAGTYSVTVTDSASCTGVVVSDTNTTVMSGNVPGATYPYSAPYAWVHGSWWSSLTGYTFDWSSGHTSTAAQWIWESYRVVHPIDGDIVYFQRSFTITGTPTGATVYITCDNGYEVSINGHFLGSAQLLTGWGPGHLTDPYVPPSGWQTVETWTVPADWLVGGTNTLYITGVNEQSDGGTVDGNPGGLIYEVVYQSISDCGCTATASKTVTVNPAPEANASSNSPVAVGATIMLYGLPNGMSSDNWSGPNGFSSPLQNPTIPNATIAMSGTYTLTVTDTNGCRDDASVDVIVTAAPTVAIEIYTDPACTNPTNSMTPQTTYYAKVSITSNNNLSYLQTVQVTLFYNDGSHPDAPTSGNTQTCAILTCTVGPPPVWASDFGSPPSPTTTWHLVDTQCSQPANLSVQTGDWIFAFIPGKVATESVTPAHWDAQGKATNKSSQTGEQYIRNKAMNWYGEITINSPLLGVDWGEVQLGLKFQDSPNPRTVSTTYIANGNYYEDIESSATWSGDGQTVALDISGVDPAPAGMFALKADNTLNYGTSNVVSSAQYVHINASGSLTGEAGVLVDTNGLWLSLGAEGVVPATYSGTIYYQISDR